jgi:Fuc2NAc and GlcNAc transferase
MWVAVCLAALLTLFGLWRFLRVAPRLSLVALPNHRSLHSKPVAVGGGFVCMVVFVLTLETYPGPWISLVGLSRVLVGALLLSILGLLDDRFALPSTPRLLAYLLVATSVVGLLAEVSWPLHVLLVLALGWQINLFNFMDGADGFALTQMLSSSVGLLLLLGFGPTPDPTLASLLLVLVAVWGVLLFFNWPPAHMFMGDAGSISLGFLLGVIGFWSYAVDPRLLTAWLILMLPFVLDASLTLLWRLGRGYPPHVGHRDHAYQRWYRRLGGALPLNLGLLLLQGIWQFPLALLCFIPGMTPVFLVFFAALPSFYLFWRARQFPYES